MRFTIKATLLALGLVAGGASQSRAAFLYVQPYDNLGFAYSSQNDTNGFGNFATAYDNFTLGTTSNVTDVHWTGQYFNPPTQGNITGFTINFYTDAGGPGALLASYSVAGAANETSLTSDVFTYDTILNTPFLAAAGTTYWMSIVPDMGFPPQWGWSTGTGGDGVGYQDFFGTRSLITNDLAFSLTGDAAPSAVPAPAGVLLGLLGLPALGVAGRLRRRAAV